MQILTCPQASNQVQREQMQIPQGNYFEEKGKGKGRITRKVCWGEFLFLHRDYRVLLGTIQTYPLGKWGGRDQPLTIIS